MNKLIAKILCFVPVVVWLVCTGYGFWKYQYNSREHDVVCGTVIQIEPYQKLAGSKHNIRTENYLLGYVNFENYGMKTLDIPIDYTFDGIGKQYCTFLERVDYSVKTPSGWEGFLLFSNALIGALLIVGCGWLFLLLIEFAWFKK